MAAQLSSELQGPGTGRPCVRYGQICFRRMAPGPCLGRVQVLARAGSAVGRCHRWDLPVTREAYLPIAFTKGRIASGRFLKSCELTRAGEIGSGPFSLSAAVPAGPNNSSMNLIAFCLFGASFSMVMPHARRAPGTATVVALCG